MALLWGGRALTKPVRAAESSATAAADQFKSAGFIPHLPLEQPDRILCNHFRTYRADAVVSLLSVTLFSRAGVWQWLRALPPVANAKTFAEFVSEIRYDGTSEVVFMTQYREPLKLRVLQTMIDIMRDSDDQPGGRTHWSDRIFFRYPDGTVQPVTQIWKGRKPAVVAHFLCALRLVDNRRVRGALRRALNDGEEFAFER